MRNTAKTKSCTDPCIYLDIPGSTLSSQRSYTKKNPKNCLVVLNYVVVEMSAVLGTWNEARSISFIRPKTRSGEPLKYLGVGVTTL